MQNAMKSIEVCLTPDLVTTYGVEGKIIVVVDILRATSCMTTALAHGIQSITPVATVEECRSLKEKGYLAAAERDGKTVDGFDFGNSPFTYMGNQFEGKKLAVTTTNGTLAITRSVKANEVVIGSFLNITAVVNYLKEQNQEIMVLCAGWKGRVNLEDTLFAGALVDMLKSDFDAENDSAIAALALYEMAKTNMLAFLKNSSHAKRLKGLSVTKDIEFCLTRDVYTIVPTLVNGELIAKHKKAALAG